VLANGERGTAQQIYLTVNKKQAEVIGIAASETEIDAGETVTLTVTSDKDSESIRIYDAVRGTSLEEYGEYTETSEGVTKEEENDSYVWTIPYTPEKTGDLYLRAYGVLANGERGTAQQIYLTVNKYYEIMGSTSITKSQMVAYYNSSEHVFPSYYAITLEQFCQIYLDQANSEGVKAEVAFVQAMKETGWLQFGGDVSITQYNFAGLGATGGGEPGNVFSSIEEGVLAQVQHLKAYASLESLNNICVDQRFYYVTRNTAPYVEWLGIPDNPYGVGWAAADDYGYDIVEMIDTMKSY
jgi:hypothetical protein